MSSIVYIPPAGGGSGTAQLKDTGGTDIGPPVPVPSGPVVDIIAPDSAVKTTDGATTVLSVKSNDSDNLPSSVIQFVNSTGSASVSGALNTSYSAPYLFPDTTIPRRELKNTLGAGLSVYVALDQLVLDTVPQAPNGSVQPKDSAGFNIGSAVAAPSGGVAVTATIGDSAIQNKDSIGTNIGSVVNVKATQSQTITTADSTLTLPNGTTTGLRATQPFNVGTYCPMKFVIAKYSYTSVEWTITADEAGSYTAWTDDGASGTWTYSKNGGAFIAATGTVSFVIGDKVIAKRTINTAQGYYRWAH